MKIHSKEWVGAFTEKDSCRGSSPGFSPKEVSWGMLGKVMKRDRGRNRTDRKTIRLKNYN